MNEHRKIGYSACPHDCPSTCALEVELLPEGKIGRLYGAKDNSYTDGVICSKVARYNERLYHKDRLTAPKQRAGDKGAGEWRDISWENALDEVANQFISIEQRYGSEAIWPYFYAGTMGFVQRDSIERLRHAKKYSGFFGTICVTPAWSGFHAGTGKLMGPDPREIAKSDCVVIWGTNPVNTQINVMTHAIKARKERGAKIIVVDIYNTGTMKKADMGIILRPGTDGALACAIMHILFRDNLADRDFLNSHSDCPNELEAHLKDKTPEWAAQITGLNVDEIEILAATLGNIQKTYLRIGYGLARVNNGAVNIHAVTSIATVLGAWKYEGGGAFHSNSDAFGLDSSLIKGTAHCDPKIRSLDQSRIGSVLCGEVDALEGGGQVHGLIIQNTNPISVAPEQNKVRKGFMRDDLFVCVHEQFMTETAELADIVLPATMFLEHDDVYRGGGQNHIVLGSKLVDSPELCRSNLYVIEELAKRLGIADKSGFGSSAIELIDDFLKRSNRGDYESLKRSKWLDCQPDFETSHYINGFAHDDKKFHFKVDWKTYPSPTRAPKNMGQNGLMGDYDTIPSLPDHWQVGEDIDASHPFKLATSPARSFLNSSFTETQSSIAKEKRPTVKIHPLDAAQYGIVDGAMVILCNERGEVKLHAEFFEGVQRGVVICEGIWPNHAHEGGVGINTLTSAKPIAPFGGAAFHDCHVKIKAIS
jgi:anaerobic selenocysteine-containing dehydrogenase